MQNEDLVGKVKELFKAQKDLDERLKAIEADKEEFYEMRRISVQLDKELRDLKNSMETQFKSTVQMQLENFEVVNKTYQRVLDFKQVENQSKRDTFIKFIGSIGGGATIALVLQWLMNLL